MTVILVRELSILPESIFYPEKLVEDSEVENLIRMMYNCDERSMAIIKATIKAAIDRIPDLRIRTAAICRYLLDMSWRDVAQHLGQEETPDGIRAALERHIRKCGGMYDE